MSGFSEVVVEGNLLSIEEGEGMVTINYQGGKVANQNQKFFCTVCYKQFKKDNFAGGCYQPAPGHPEGGVSGQLPPWDTGGHEQGGGVDHEHLPPGGVVEYSELKILQLQS